ncbi:MAG TPA: NUDIX hydrolase [Acidimicrobiales bacterium]|nr:NUDIX hydrolase [Acidimicrobiales bacterium]
MSKGPSLVRAAGGVVWRRGPTGIDVVLVHRPRYDDWTLPKGKLEGGEDDVAAATREVHEEAGVRCDVGPELAVTDYVDRNGRPKTVRYWAMTVREGEVGGANEVDVAEWVPVAEARARLTYRRDEPVLDALVALLADR